VTVTLKQYFSNITLLEYDNLQHQVMSFVRDKIGDQVDYL
jgi:hypothetical protein